MTQFLVWDFDGTLAQRSGGWAGALCEAAASVRPGTVITPETVRPHLRSGFPWHMPDVIRASCPPDRWWQDLSPVLSGALVAAAGLAAHDAERVAQRVRATYLKPESWRLFEDSLPALTKLRDLGWKHLVLSNHVPELAILVERLGLSRFIEACYSSGCTGSEKPNAADFECVFSDYPAARAGWMIGDSWSADVLGARSVGMRAVLVRNRHAEATVHCETLDGVVRVIGRAGQGDE
ncbi:MAG: HAD family hydrolase [Longimicrobiales bacterium]